jgi:hypothetical protein
MKAPVAVPAPPSGADEGAPPKLGARDFLVATTVVLVVAPILLAGLVLGAMRLLNRHLNSTGEVSVRLAGLGQGRPGTFTSSLPAHYDAFRRDWLASGTNVAVFTVTNGTSRSLLLQPYAGFFEETNAPRSRYETVLPASPDGYGFLLRPGEARTVEVAILPREGSGFIRFGCVPNYRDALPRLLEEAGSVIQAAKRAEFQSEWIFSEPISPR